MSTELNAFLAWVLTDNIVIQINMDPDYLNKLPFRNPGLIKAIDSQGVVKNFEEGVQLITEGQEMRYIPFVLNGSIRVFASNDDKELLLYHIHSNESCIMSLAVSLKNEPAKINAVTEMPTLLMLLPVQRVLEWLNEFPEFNLVFYNQFYKRYADLVDTLQQMVFNNLEVRLLDYLRDQSSQASGGIVDLRHRQMAADLGTVREVITRTLKKLEKAGHIRQSKAGIEILD